MVMDTIQVRLPRATLESIDAMVERGIYASRSDAIRDAARKLFWESQVGTVKDNDPRSSVEIVRELRERLSKEPIDLNAINALADRVSRHRSTKRRS